jgi:hypothetical protein
VIVNGGVANYAPYCHFSTGWLVGYDGIVAAGVRAHEQLNVCPQTELFRHAVSRAGGALTLTERADGTLYVSGDAVRASIPCFPQANIPNVVPDAAYLPVSQSLSKVLVAISKIAAARHETVIGSSVLLKSDSVVGTDGATIVEGHHGSQLPYRWVLPREFCDALAKVKTVPTHCGWSADTFTLWFGTDMWLRTNTYEDKYPDTDLWFARLMSSVGEYRPIPLSLLMAIETLKPFRYGDTLGIYPYGLNTLADGTGAAYHMQHDIAYVGGFPSAGLKLAAEHGSWIAFSTEGAYWYGDVIRGITALEVKP